ncbi:MAG: CBS domain-containing protein [Georgfuchsia sp.]
MQHVLDTGTREKAGERMNQNPGEAQRGKKLKLRDQFFRVLMMGYADRSALVGRVPQHGQLTGMHHHLLHSNINSNAVYHVPMMHSGDPVTIESPAIKVMTDFQQIDPITIRSFYSIEEANRMMIKHDIRALFVVDDEHRLTGLITSSDILGEKPVKISQQRALSHDEIAVSDIMTPASRLEFIELDEILKAQVGDVVDTLEHLGRQHAMVVERSGGENGSRQMIRGIFSLTQVARQLGIKIHTPVIGHTFDEIVSAIGH